MAKGPPYHRLKMVGRPTVDEYRTRVVDESNKKVSTKKFKCNSCGHVMFYQAKRCPNCDKEGTMEEDEG